MVATVLVAVVVARSSSSSSRICSPITPRAPDPPPFSSCPLSHRRLGFQPEELEAQDMYSLLEPSSCVRVKQLLSQLIDDWENTTNEQESGSSNQVG